MYLNFASNLKTHSGTCLETGNIYAQEFKLNKSLQKIVPTRLIHLYLFHKKTFSLFAAISVGALEGAC